MCTENNHRFTFVALFLVYNTTTMRTPITSDNYRRIKLIIQYVYEGSYKTKIFIFFKPIVQFYHVYQ